MAADFVNYKKIDEREFQTGNLVRWVGFGKRPQNGKEISTFQDVRYLEIGGTSSKNLELEKKKVTLAAWSVKQRNGTIVLCVPDLQESDQGLEQGRKKRKEKKKVWGITGKNLIIKAKGQRKGTKNLN